MNRNIPITKQKVAEKLLILTERSKGILCRLHHMKNTLKDPKTKPSIFKERIYEPALKQIKKAFPSTDSKNYIITTILAIDTEIINSLGPLYFTFVDILEFKDETKELIVTVTTYGIRFHAHLNFDLTRLFLELVADFISIMVIMGSISERKLICSVFNHVYDANRGQHEPSFPRLGNMLIDYDQPLRKLSEEFTPCNTRVLEAIVSFSKAVHELKTSDVQMLRSQQILTITENPLYILHPKNANWPYNLCVLSLETICRWVLLGFLICTREMAQKPEALELCKKCVEYGYTVVLHRNETILITQALIDQLKLTKIEKKISSSLSQTLNEATNSCALNCRTRRQDVRNYLRFSLKELSLLLIDSPGLLGPKLFVILMGMSMLRDEILWMVKHSKATSPKTKAKITLQDFIDPHLPELLFLMSDLKELIYRNITLIQNYYLKYLSGYDAAIMRDVIQRIQVAPEEESLLMTSFVETLLGLQNKTANSGETFDFSGLRLDWQRLQVSISQITAQMSLFENDQLGINMNEVVMHTRAVDDLPALIEECSDLSFFCFYREYFEQDFKKCLQQRTQLRFAIAYPMIAAEFLNATHELCPEERHIIGEISINKVNQYLDIIAGETCELLANNIEKRMSYNQIINTTNAANSYNRQHAEKTKKTEKALLKMENIEPGEESRVYDRVQFFSNDEKFYQLTDICSTLNKFIKIDAWGHTFGPREYLIIYLEQHFLKFLHTNLQADPSANRIRRPSELLNQLVSLITAIRSLELYLNMDLSRFLTRIMLEQSQTKNSKGDPTIASYYADWYAQTIRDITNQDIELLCYCEERKAFLSRSSYHFRLENYVNYTELMALAEMVGPYGFRLLREKLLEDVANQIKEIKRLVIGNKEVLITIRNNINRTEILNQHCKRVLNSDEFNNRLIIIGLLLAFRNLSLDALNSVLTNRSPFMLNAVLDIKNYYKHEDTIVCMELALAAGVKGELDPILVNLLKVHVEETQEDLELWSLFMVLVGVTIPELGHKQSSTYNTILGAHENNAHCLALAISTLAGCIFHKFGVQQPYEKMQEFLQLITNRLLKCCQENEKSREYMKYKDDILMLLNMIVKMSPYLTMDMLESYFPYALIRESYRRIKTRKGGKKKAKTEDEAQF